ncbi:hypothetical protein BaRGS_00020160 [Batillaria attramentaria]|uniref:Uncharacterized protein n=1 Tax=Batillaria attramentaria TaxID=370345 RepID=A0ABD0KMQ7_9CAEN
MHANEDTFDINFLHPGSGGQYKYPSRQDRAEVQKHLIFMAPLCPPQPISGGRIFCLPYFSTISKEYDLFRKRCLSLTDFSTISKEYDLFRKRCLSLTDFSTISKEYDLFRKRCLSLTDFSTISKEYGLVQKKVLVSYRLLHHQQRIRLVQKKVLVSYRLLHHQQRIRTCSEKGACLLQTSPPSAKNTTCSEKGACLLQTSPPSAKNTTCSEKGACLLQTSPPSAKNTTCSEKGLCASTWQDTKRVNVLSTVHGNTVHQGPSRCHHEPTGHRNISKPSMTHDYKFMSGVDRMDQHVILPVPTSPDKELYGGVSLHKGSRTPQCLRNEQRTTLALVKTVL